MLSRNRFCLLDGKIRDKSRDSLFYLIYFDSMLHTIIFQAFVLTSASKKFFSLCCYVFLSFCPRFSFRGFANLKLSFSLQKLLGRQEKQLPFLEIFICSRGKLLLIGN